MFRRNGGKRKIFFCRKPSSIYGPALDVSKSTDDVKSTGEKRRRNYDAKYIQR